jgi:hypothetical protein
MDSRIDAIARDLLEFASGQYKAEYQLGNNTTIPPFITLMRFDEGQEKPSAIVLPEEICKMFFNAEMRGGKDVLMKMVQNALTEDIPWPDNEKRPADFAMILVEAYMRESSEVEADTFKEGDLAEDDRSEEAITLQVHSREGTSMYVQKIAIGELKGEMFVLGANGEGKSISGRMTVPPINQN